jgi:hypothetical protein
LDNIASLICHPETPSGAVKEIIVDGDRAHNNFITIRYRVIGDMGRIVVPPAREPGRASGLWETTCMELFTQDEGEQEYREYNFSPSGQWAAYGFSGYREGMEEIAIWAPRIETVLDGEELVVTVDFLSPRFGPQRVGAAAVIEEKDGTKSYWALLHPGDKPDFHHPDCFERLIPSPVMS